MQNVVITITAVALLAGISLPLCSKDIQVTQDVVDIENNSAPDPLSGTLYGDMKVGHGYAPLFFIRNASDTTSLTVSSVVVTGPQAGSYNLLNVRGGEIGPGSFGYFNLQFRPQLVGTHEASVIIQSDDPDEGTFSLNVRGEAFPVDQLPAKADLDLQSAGEVKLKVKRSGTVSFKAKALLFNNGPAASMPGSFLAVWSPDRYYTGTGTTVDSGNLRTLRAFVEDRPAHSRKLRIKGELPAPGGYVFVVAYPVESSEHRGSDNILRLSVPLE